MLIKAEQKFLRMSPRKLRYTAGSVAGVKKPSQVIALLNSAGKRASLPLVKVVKQAVANAKNNLGLNEEDLVIKELVVNEGPPYKRWRAGSRGRAMSIKKRSSHIRVVLETKSQEKLKEPSFAKASEGKEHGTKS